MNASGPRAAVGPVLVKELYRPGTIPARAEVLGLLRRFLVSIQQDQKNGSGTVSGDATKMFPDTFVFDQSPQSASQ